MNRLDKDRKYIIFGEEHYNPLGVIRSLGQEGIRPIAIIRKGDFGFASASKYISTKYIVASIEEGYKILLEQYGNENKKPILLTTDDQITSFLDKHYDELKDKFIFYNAGQNGRISYYMEKNNINGLAIKYGLNVAKNWVVKPGEIPEDIEYPVMTKAIISTLDDWKQDSFICKDESELKAAFKHIRSEKILIQKFINKKNELCLDGFTYNKGKNVFYAIASNYINIKKDGYSNYMIVKNSNNTDIEDKLNKMFEEIGFEGIFSVEFLIDQDDKLYFLEINLRNSTWSWASTKAGMNLPILWSKAMIENKKEQIPVVNFKEFKAMAEFTDFKDRVSTHEISIFKWLIQMISCKCRYFIDFKDNKPIINRIMHKVKKVMRRSNEN